MIENGKDRNAKIDYLISKFELDNILNVKAKLLSGGQKKKLVIAMALIGNPPEHAGAYVSAVRCEQTGARGEAAATAEQTGGEGPGLEQMGAGNLRNETRSH